MDYITSDEVRALVLMWLITHGATEYIKRIARKYRLMVDKWSPMSIAFVAGFLATMAVWPAASSVHAWQSGLAWGFGYPWIYKMAIPAIRTKWPELADKISGGHK